MAEYQYRHGFDVVVLFHDTQSAQSLENSMEDVIASNIGNMNVILFYSDVELFNNMRY